LANLRFHLQRRSSARELAGDISEIYFDLKQSLELEKTSAPRSDVLFDWRFDFRSRWGRHLVGALAAIHHQNIE
jgi:Domain of unknown function (DUF5063)